MADRARQIIDVMEIRNLALLLALQDRLAALLV
jgi:hypothetical protein